MISKLSDEQRQYIANILNDRQSFVEYLQSVEKITFEAKYLGAKYLIAQWLSKNIPESLIIVRGSDILVTKAYGDCEISLRKDLPDWCKDLIHRYPSITKREQIDEIRGAIGK